MSIVVFIEECIITPKIIFNSFKKLTTLAFLYLIYCCEIWGNTAAVHVDLLIKLQTKCVRIITFSMYLTPSKPIFKNLNILRFEKLTIQKIKSLMMYKYNISQLLKLILELFSVNSNVHNLYTRSGSCLHTPLGWCEATYRTLVIIIWKHISQKVRTDVFYSKFKYMYVTQYYLINNDIPIIRLNV